MHTESLIIMTECSSPNLCLASGPISPFLGKSKRVYFLLTVFENVYPAKELKQLCELYIFYIVLSDNEEHGCMCYCYLALKYLIINK